MTQLIEVSIEEPVEKVGVIADTHIPTRGRFIPPVLFDLFDGVDLIIHAGDLVDLPVLDDLKALAPVVAVAGNMDPLRLRSELGRLKLIRAGQAEIGLLHGDTLGYRFDGQSIRRLFQPHQPGAVVFGHLHEPINRLDGEMLLFNPGSAVDPRHSPRPSCGILTLNGSRVEGEILYI